MAQGRGGRRPDHVRDIMGQHCYPLVTHAHTRAADGSGGRAHGSPGLHRASAHCHYTGDEIRPQRTLVQHFVNSATIRIKRKHA